MQDQSSPDYTFPLQTCLVEYLTQKLKAGSICLGLRFKGGSVCHGRKGMGTGWLVCAAWNPQRTSQQNRKETAEPEIQLAY